MKHLRSVRGRCQLFRGKVRIVPGSAVINPGFCNSYTLPIAPLCPANSKPTDSICTCNDSYFPDSTKTSCVTETYKLELTPATATIEPGKNYTFTATVTNQDDEPPSRSVPVSVKVEVEANSGGHAHDDAARPKGSVSPASGDKSFSINFTATAVSGTHTITATCDLCTNKMATAKVDVKVDGLETIPASQFFAFVGETTKHSDNHYLVPEAAEVLWRIAVSYQVEQQFKLADPATKKPTVTPPVLHVNDASLKWGGKFDLSGGWTGSHYEHRRGTVVDIRANNLDTAIPTEKFKEFRSLAADYGADAFLESPSVGKRHFHLRLLNREE